MEEPIKDSASAEVGKRLLRKACRAARQARSRDTQGWQRANLQLQQKLLSACPPRAGLSLFSYLAMPDEADTGPLFDVYQQAGTQVLVPVIEGRSPMQACVFKGWNTLVAGMLGIRRPRESDPWTLPVSVALVPGLAFTVTGDRLGYGGGYYDRWLTEHPEALRVGVCLDFQLREFLPTQAHDVSMDLVVTNAGAWWTHRRADIKRRQPPSC